MHVQPILVRPLKSCRAVPRTANDWYMRCIYTTYKQQQRNKTGGPAADSPALIKWRQRMRNSAKSKPTNRLLKIEQSGQRDDSPPHA